MNIVSFDQRMAVSYGVRLRAVKPKSRGYCFGCDGFTHDDHCVGKCQPATRKDGEYVIWKVCHEPYRHRLI